MVGFAQNLSHINRCRKKNTTNKLNINKDKNNTNKEKKRKKTNFLFLYLNQTY